jgi:hypothetical protein
MLRAVGSVGSTMSARILEIQAGMARADRKETYRNEDQFHCGGIFSCNAGSSKSIEASA